MHADADLTTVAISTHTTTGHQLDMKDPELNMAATNTQTPLCYES